MPEMETPLDYLALGHVTLDRQPDGSTLPGGTVLFAALQAARLGLRAGIVTAGRPADLDAALAPYRAELSIALRPAPETTVFSNVGVGTARRQTIHSWAGPVDRVALPLPPLGPRAIVHLGPVAYELDPSWSPGALGDAFVGVTPQGWLRRREADGTVRGKRLWLPEPYPACHDAVILSETEERLAGELVEIVRRAGIVAITRGARGCTLLDAAGPRDIRALPLPPEAIVDDTGAGDVFAAAFLVALREGQGPDAAARFAHVAAALSIGGRGVVAIAGREAIERVLGAWGGGSRRPVG